jgi:hypothetical protein
MMASNLKMSRLVLLGALGGGWLVLTACNTNGDRFFPDVDVPDVIILTSEDGGDIVPVDIASVDDVKPNTIYAEVGPARTTGYGGVTFDIVGTGDPICVWVDPEVAFWNEAIAARPAEDDKKWAYPDNVFDDGDLDLFIGLSVYYTGSPGETIGDFVVQYEDSLGNVVPVSLADCPNRFGPVDWCTLPSTQVGVSYTVLLRTWSTPLDDDRLAFGLLVANGSCESLQTTVLGATGDVVEECLITGEAITPDGLPGPFYGFDEVRDRVWDRSIEFEEQFCLLPDVNDRSVRMSVFCEDELNRVQEAGGQCEREVITDPENRCFCGDPNKSPSPGGS